MCWALQREYWSNICLDPAAQLAIAAAEARAPTQKRSPLAANSDDREFTQMSQSARLIADQQARWASGKTRDAKWDAYLPRVADNLFHELHPDSRREFDSGDGSEISDSRSKPAKMRALASSSALAVNFFDSWRSAEKATLASALGLPAPITELRFEYKTREYPVKPPSPNLDLLLHLADGESVGIESKFSEPFRSDDGHGVLSARYFPAARDLWSEVHQERAQRIVTRLRPEWIHLDVPQLLKHLLGLANDPDRPTTLLYLWFDTGLSDAVAHSQEIEQFTESIAGDGVNFRALTYQSVFGSLAAADSPVEGWFTYLQQRYFAYTVAA